MEISHCEYANGKWQVKFIRGRVYSYNYSSVQWLKNLVSFDGETTVVYEKTSLIGC